MKLTYIFHSGFAVEGDGFAILFDYYQDTKGDTGHGFVHDELLSRSGRLYVLSSHSHADHFNQEILAWKENRADIIYIFSKDILKYKKAHPEDAHYLDQSEIYEDDLLKVEAFGSTDLGVSFLVEVAGKLIFHAGDLNNWHWKDESTEEEIRKAENDYLKELSLLAGSVDHLDLAMFPVDKRLGTDYMRGAEQFVGQIPTDLFSPMHFGEEYASAAAFARFAGSKGTQVIAWSRKGESVEF